MEFVRLFAMRFNRRKIFQAMIAGLALHLCASLAWAQSTAFTYQGQLKTNGAPANGAHDFEFKLFDAVAAGTQLGSTNTLSNVTVTNGVFTLTLDFGAQFNGQPRWLEISARTAGAGAFTPLTPRQPLTSTPYAVRSATAGLADNASQLGGIAANQFTQTTDARLTDARTPTAGSANYIQNGVATQTASFNINGNGTTSGTLSGGTVNAVTQYNLNGSRILDEVLASTLYVGLNAGAINSAAQNTFVGHNAGAANSTGPNNTFVGFNAGLTNSTGDLNTFLGSNAGRDNTTGTQNTFLGATAGLLNNIGNFNTFVGRNAGRENINGDDNSFFGDDAGTNNATGIQNSYFGSFAGTAGTVGENNTFIGYRAGDANTTGSANTTRGSASDVLSNNLSNATAIGFRAAVSASNALVLGSINGVNGSTANTNIGIGTTTPTFRLHVRAGAQNGIKIQNDGSGDFQQIRWTDAADAFKAAISVGPVGSEDMRFFVNGSDRMIIQNTGNIVITTLGIAGTNQLCRNASNQIATCSSSLRYKKNIAPFASGLNLVNRLQPITFDWKAGGTHDLGLGAEDVAAISELLVIRNDKGEVEGVKYDRIGVVLLNAVKEQQQQIETLRAEKDALALRLAALEQRVSSSPRAKSKRSQRNR